MRTLVRVGMLFLLVGCGGATADDEHVVCRIDAGGEVQDLGPCVVTLDSQRSWSCDVAGPCVPGDVCHAGGTPLAGVVTRCTP